MASPRAAADPSAAPPASAAAAASTGVVGSSAAALASGMTAVAGGDGSSSSKLGVDKPQPADTKRESLEDSPDDCTLFVGNLDYKLSELTFVKLFQKLGTVVREELMVHRVGPQRGMPKGYGFIQYSSREEADTAIRLLNGKSVNGRRLIVHKALSKDSVKRKLTVEGGAAKKLRTVEPPPLESQAEAIRRKLMQLERSD